jgi:formylglycine-generating enzyme required for sulfatase activity
MQTRSVVLAVIADVLAELYYDAGRATTMATTAGLRLAIIPFYPRALDTWTALIQEAETQGCTPRILDRAQQEYPAHAPLQAASQAYVAWVAAGRPGDPAPAHVVPDAQPTISRQDFEPVTILVPGGPFLMGGVGSPPYRVDQPTYRIGQYPVKNSEYLTYVRQTGTGVAPEAGWMLAAVGQVPPAGKENLPMVGVSWDEAMAYCHWLSQRTGRQYRLPTEAEWEKAASWVAEIQTQSAPTNPAGTGELDPARKRVYPWGSEFDAARCNGLPANVGGPTAVGQYSPQGDSAYSCADMAGNVWEWTHTWWGRERALAEFSDPYRPDDGRERAEPLAGAYREFRIARGGSFREQPERLTCAARTRFAADSRDRARGFRVVMILD